MGCFIPFLRLHHREKQHKREEKLLSGTMYIRQGLIRKNKPLQEFITEGI